MNSLTSMEIAAPPPLSETLPATDMPAANAEEMPKNSRFRSTAASLFSYISQIVNLKKRTALVWLVTLVTLGSGLVNLFSLIVPSLPERKELLRNIFPLEFLHLSKFLTLLIGLALVVSSINIFKRKKRAYQTALLLASLSVVFQLTKGLDYEEACASLLLAATLILTRRIFTVRSSVPDLRSGLMRLSAVLIAALAYGTAGFWFLDRKEFGINFNIINSIFTTLRYLSLLGDASIVPHTRHAHWFLSSLYLTTSATIVYALFSLFRPVVYQFIDYAHERAEAMGIVAKHGRSSIDYFKYWPDKSYFFSPSQKTFIAYRAANGFAVVLGDPVGPQEEIEQTVRDFLGFCKENDWEAALHQTMPDYIPIYRKLGLKKLKIGDDAIVDLEKFSLAGKSMKKLRNAINRLEESGVRARFCEPPIAQEIFEEVKEVSDEWLQIPGRRERGFTLGMFESSYICSTPLFIVEDKDGKILAFANIIPSYSEGESTIDLMRHRKEAPNGIMDYLFLKLFQRCKENGFRRFNLGMAPMSGFQEKEEASLEEKAVHYFFQNLNFLFSFTGLRQYKAKFATSWEPRYAIYRNALDLPKLAIALNGITEFKK